jgi:hypothetical protein
LDKFARKVLIKISFEFIQTFIKFMQKKMLLKNIEKLFFFFNLARRPFFFRGLACGAQPAHASIGLVRPSRPWQWPSGPASPAAKGGLPAAAARPISGPSADGLGFQNPILDPGRLFDPTVESENRVYKSFLAAGFKTLNSIFISSSFQRSRRNTAGPMAATAGGGRRQGAGARRWRLPAG